MKLKAAIGVLNQTPFDWENNRQHIVGAIDEARSQGASVLCLPELCISGYGCEDMFHANFLLDAAWEVLESLVDETRGMVVSVGLPVMHRSGVYNAAALLVDGDIAGLVAKQNLAGDGIHYEPRWFKPWPATEVATLERNGRSVPLGDLSFDVGGVLMGFEICEDAWVAARPGAELAAQGVDLILNPSASHFAFGKQAIRQRLVLEGSRAFGAAYLYANLLGNEAGRAIYDGGGMIANAGELLTDMPRFSYAPFRVRSAVIDIDKARLHRSRTASFQADVHKSDRCHVVPFEYPQPERQSETLTTPTWEKGELLKEETFTRAIALGLFDYMRKARSQGYVVSISGGADSAACTCLVGLMIRFAVAELGIEAVRNRLSHLHDAQNADEHDLIARVLTTVYQSTRNSSDTTRDAANAVAKDVGATHHELDVDGIVASYRTLIEGAIERELTWDRDDVALQNIQARTRAPSAWMLANIRGQILVSTSNRSEAAVGYATMDGDTSGGIAPIAGIDKAFLLQWLQWLEKTGPEGIGPYPALRYINEQVPTAELRPPEQSQTDEADLMPYPILDAIECAAIRDKKSPEQTLAYALAEFPQYDETQMRAWVIRFFRLWQRNQWKRERYAPSFHVDDKNLDPKTWCRFPILSGPLELER